MRGLRILLLLLAPLLQPGAPALAQAPGGVSFAEARELQDKGYRFYEGRWRLPQEIVYLQRRAAREWAATRPQPETAAPSESAPAGASPVADPATDPDAALRALAEAMERAERDYWLRRVRSAPAVPAAIGILELRLQKVDFLGFDTVPVSFGTGGMGTLQLPRTRSISLGTTVALPLGIGR